MRSFINLQNSPNYNPVVKNGINSISAKRVIIVEQYGTKYPWCVKHHHMNKVSSDGIWRCLACNEGAYEIKC